MVIGNGSGAGKSRVDVNVTPLIDVLLVLLIIFMVTAPVPQHGLDAQVPQPSTGTNHQDEVTVVVSVQKETNGQVNYKINQQGLSLPDLAGRLKAIISIRADKEVFIEGDPGLDFSTIAQVLDIAKVARAEHVGLITRKSAI